MATMGSVDSEENSTQLREIFRLAGLGLFAADLAAPQRFLEAIHAAWLAEDLEAVYRAASENPTFSYPGLRSAILERRNRQWAPLISSKLSDGERTLIAVGALHFAGPNNIVQLMGRKIEPAVSTATDVVFRANLVSLPLEDLKGQPLALLPLLRTLEIGQAADWPAQARDKGGIMLLRVCAYRKTVAQTQATQKKIQQEARKKKQIVKPETLEGAAYVIVVTTLTEPSAPAIMEFYRRRWQIELAFKRLKSLLGLGHLKKFDKDGARAWLQGKLLVACLIEKLIFTAERFSPWGYETRGRSAADTPLTLA